jgi:hypothetical protein
MSLSARPRKNCESTTCGACHPVNQHHHGTILATLGSGRHFRRWTLAAGSCELSGALDTKRVDSAGNRKTPDWERYERLVARLVADQLSTAYCVIPNAKARGKISERSRQIDVLIDVRHDTDNRQWIIIDAKARAWQIDVNHVEAFRGLMATLYARMATPLRPNAERRRPSPSGCCCLIAWKTSTSRPGQSTSKQVAGTSGAVRPAHRARPPKRRRPAGSWIGLALR